MKVCFKLLLVLLLATTIKPVTAQKPITQTNVIHTAVSAVENGKNDEIYEKWFGEEENLIIGQFWRYVIISGCLLAIVVIIVIQKRMRKARNDIKNASNIMRISIHKFEALFNSMEVAVEYYDSDGNIVDYNEKSSELWGLGEKEKTLAKGSNLFTYPYLTDDNKEKIRSGESVKYTTEYDFDYIKKLDIIDTRKTGKYIFTSTICPVKDANGELAGYVTNVTDVTDIHNYQTQLEQSRKRWENMYQENMNVLLSMPIGIALYDNNGNETYINAKMAEVCGITDITYHLELHINIFDNPVISDKTKDKLKRKENADEFVYCNMKKIADAGYFETTLNDVILVEMKIRIVYDADMKMSGYMMIVRDLTKIERQQKKLIDSEAMNEMILNNINTGLVYLSKDYVVGWNNMDCFKDVLNRSTLRNYVQGTTCYKHVHGIDEPCKDCCLKEAFETHKAVTVEKVFDEGKLIVNITAIPICNADGSLKGGLFKIEDVTEKTRQHRELELYEAKTQLIIDNCDIVQWDYDLKRKASFVYHPNAVLPNQWLNEQEHLAMVHPDDHMLVHNMYKSMNAAEDKALSARFRTMIKGEEGYRNVETNCIPVKDNSGNIVSYAGFRRDITEEVKMMSRLRGAKQRAETSVAMLRDVIEHMPLAVFIKDAITHRYIMVNQIFAQLRHLEKNEVAGRCDYDIFSENAVKIFRQKNIEAVNAVGKNIHSTHVLKIDGEDTILESNQMLVQMAEGHDLIVGLLNDVTGCERERQELKSAKERAEQSDRLKSAFLANMSHEIRTPLNAIVGFSNLLSESDDKSAKEEYMKIISTNNDLLLRLIGDILDMSKIESGIVDFEYSKFNMATFFDEFMATMKLRCVNPDVKLIVENPYKYCEVNLDSKRLAQVINNYMTNAIKYTPSGQIKAKYEYNGEGLMISVSDTGIGIPDDKKNKIFQRFEKVDNFAQGNGLGLSITKAIVEKFGGRVGFDSVEGKGSTFWAWIPVKAEILE